MFSEASSIVIQLIAKITFAWLCSCASQLLLPCIVGLLDSPHLLTFQKPFSCKELGPGLFSTARNPSGSFQQPSRPRSLSCRAAPTKPEGIMQSKQPHSCPAASSKAPAYAFQRGFDGTVPAAAVKTPEGSMIVQFVPNGQQVSVTDAQVCMKPQSAIEGRDSFAPHFFDDAADCASGQQTRYAASTGRRGCEELVPPWPRSMQVR